jgi:hypothetical protein
LSESGDFVERVHKATTEEIFRILGVKQPPEPIGEAGAT